MANVTKKAITNIILEKERKLFEEYNSYYNMYGEDHWLTQQAQAKWSALFDLVYIDLKIK